MDEAVEVQVFGDCNKFLLTSLVRNKAAASTSSLIMYNIIVGNPRWCVHLALSNSFQNRVY